MSILDGDNDDLFNSILGGSARSHYAQAYANYLLQQQQLQQQQNYNQYLNQLYNGALNNGHRNSPSPLHGNPNPSPRGGNPGNNASPAWLVTAGIGTLRLASTLGGSNFTPARDVPSEGIRAGEVIGYRAWRLIGGATPRLKAISAGMCWEPGVIMEGDVNMHGIFAFKDRARNWQEWAVLEGEYVIGTVWMWGEIVEHEHGYRSTRASVRSIDHITEISDKPRRRRTSFLQWLLFGYPDPEPSPLQEKLAELRAIYGVEEIVK